jgi:hypothetical protein
VCVGVREPGDWLTFDRRPLKANSSGPRGRADRGHRPAQRSTRSSMAPRPGAQSATQTRCAVPAAATSSSSRVIARSAHDPCARATRRARARRPRTPRPGRRGLGFVVLKCLADLAQRRAPGRRAADVSSPADGPDRRTIANRALAIALAAHPARAAGHAERRARSTNRPGHDCHRGWSGPDSQWQGMTASAAFSASVPGAASLRRRTVPLSWSMCNATLWA